MVEIVKDSKNAFFVKFFLDLILRLSVFLPVCMCMHCVCQKRVLDLLEVESLMVVSHHVGAQLFSAKAVQAFNL